MVHMVRFYSCFILVVLAARNQPVQPRKGSQSFATDEIELLQTEVRGCVPVSNMLQKAGEATKVHTVGQRDP